jgi:hypothetical protein
MESSSPACFKPCLKRKREREREKTEREKRKKEREREGQIHFNKDTAIVTIN